MTVGVLIVLIIVGGVVASGLLGVGFYRYGYRGALESFWYGFLVTLTAGSLVAVVVALIAGIVSTWTVPL